MPESEEDGSCYEHESNQIPNLVRMACGMASL